jgi:predicted Zn-dependent peptidase
VKVQSSQTLDIAQPDLNPRLPDHAASPVISTGKLSNGVQIATWENFGPVSSLTFSLNASSRFESPENAGVSHFLRLFGFRVNISLSLQSSL